MEKKLALQMRGITKRFGTKVIANKNVDLDVYQGEILSILGENGCGKTTLMNMIAGIYYPDEGQIFINGEEVIIRSPKEAFAHKIGMVHQHFKLVDIFTAAENIILGVDDRKGYNTKAVNSRVAEIAERYGFHIDPKKKIYEMSVSEKQTVEIIKVLYRGADILILDEPTAVLTPQEISHLFAVLRRMREDGKTVIIITHKLNEVMEISDRVTILRKGELIGTVNTAETSENQLTEMMVGKKIDLNIERSTVEELKPRLTVKGLCSQDEEGLPVLKDVSFTVNGGEILGIAGIAGSGQRELLEAIAGIQPLTAGEITFFNPKKHQPLTFFHKDMKRVRTLDAQGMFLNKDLSPLPLAGHTDREVRDMVSKGEVLFREDEEIDLRDRTPLEIRQLGVRLSFVPEDRLGMGLVGSMGISDNMMLRSYRKGHIFFLDRKKPRTLAKEIIESLEVVTPNANTPVRRLSGGNVQKVLVGREIAASPKVLMAAYPVRGLDINSSYTIYNLLNKQKVKGVAVIFVGEDLDVLMALCDRILVMNGGRVTGIVDGRTADKEELGRLMTRTDLPAQDAGTQPAEKEGNAE